jgi:sugar phosphate isomerase/epimerase
LAGDVVAEEISLTGAGLAHYHIAEPKLGGFADPTCRHHDAGAALRRIGYAGWLVIEMLEQPDGFAAVETAIRHAREAYG